MKKFLKIAGIAVLALVLLAILLPFLFKGKIKSAVQQEINNNLNAEVTFDKVGLSIIRHFPDLTLRLSGLTVKGTGDFSNDTLTTIPALRLTLDLGSVFRGKDYEVKRVVLTNPDIRLKVLANGKANWDIMKESETTDTVSAPSNFKANLRSFELAGANFSYSDAEINAFFAMNGIDGTLSGDMTVSNTKLKVDAVAEKVFLDYDGVRYMNGIKTSLQTLLDADIDNFIFKFAGADLLLNGLGLKADGMFAMPADGYDMDITFQAREDTFKSFLSLIPAIYAKDFDKVSADGKLAFSGFVKGKYSDTSLPAFDVNLQVSDGSFSYPGLPGKVSEIRVSARVSNPDGVMDNTLVDIPELHLLMMQNPVDASFSLKTPVSDPDIKGKLKGLLNLSDIAKIYPLGEKTTLSGTVNADVSFAGRMSALEQGKYDQFKAEGFAVMDKINYSSPDFPQPVIVHAARLDFSPAFVSLGGCKMNIGNNDLAAEGKISNYLPFLLKHSGTLQGTLTATSTNFDLNTISSGSTSTATTDTSAMTAIEIPGGIDFTVSTSFGKLVYDTYEMQNVNGKIRIRDKILFLDNLSVDMLGGNLSVAGTYNAVNIEKPTIDMDLKVKNIDVRQTFKTFNTLEKIAPIAEKLTGKISTTMKFSGDLRKDMVPELTSVSGAGLVLSDILSIDNNINTFNIVADVLKMEKLRKPAIEKVNLSWDLVNGMATVKPMDFVLGKYKANFSGTTSLDQTINFILNLDIPRSEFGGKANSVLNGFISDAAKKGINVNPGEIIPVTLLIGGTITNPKITAGFKQVMTGMAETLKQQVAEQIQAKKEEVIAKAKDEANKLIEQADAQAARILELAQQQSDNIMKLAQSGAEKVRVEADSISSRMVAEGKKNGMVAEIAAKKSAEKVKKEADTKASRILDEARQRSNALLEKARQEADQVKQAARAKVN